MEPNEYLAWKMEEVAKFTDVENRHQTADKLLVATLRSHGYHDAMDIYEAMEKCYA